jgi:3-isopropylmalate/(R)-2-methylmalate dehydratase small subunit
MVLVRGKAYVVGDDINTDVIIPGRYLVKVEPEHLGEHAMEGIDPEFPRKVREDGLSIVVAGRNFGCGSSREQAPVALRGAGVKLVIAKSFARIFWRNALLQGNLKLVEADIVGKTDTGDELEVDFESGIVRNLKKGEVHRFSATYPRELLEVIEAGGLINYLKRIKPPPK